MPKQKSYPMRCSSCGKKEVFPAILEKYEDTTRETRHADTAKETVYHHKFVALNVPIFRCRSCGEILFGNDSHDVISQAIQAKMISVAVQRKLEE